MPQGTWATVWPAGRSRDSVPDVELNVSTTSQEDHAVVTAVGELDLYTAPRLQAALAGLLREEVDRIVVDLSGVEFCDSTGMNVLLAAMKRLKEQGGSLELAAPRPAVKRILQVTGLDTVFTVNDAAPAMDAG
ncbi:anti-sigma factor antagonist [Actinomadura sp. GC306]|nr:anti-sigma factor antagonist [Actinomadura sp. GC306]